MQISAMVVREPGAPFICEEVTLDEPRADEALIRLVATGVCHTDIRAVSMGSPFALPLVAGHEGAGVVEKVGADVTHVAPGDHAVLSFNSCGECGSCRRGLPSYCVSFRALNVAGARTDGSVTLTKGCEPIHGSFFSQSSFATYALASARNIVKVSKSLPLERLGPLGCGILTGAGAVLNTFKPWGGASIAVFGAGGVGLSAVMAANLVGCGMIFAIDKVTSRLALAAELGATNTIDVARHDAAEVIKAAGGVDFALDTTATAAGVKAAITSLKPAAGMCGLVGPRPDLSIPASDLAPGRTIKGIVEGDADPQVFIPQLLAFHARGEFPFEKLLRFYEFADINQAIADSRSGLAIKPIIRISTA